MNSTQTNLKEILKILCKAYGLVMVVINMLVIGANLIAPIQTYFEDGIRLSGTEIIITMV
ncbi:hypothetical protein JW887_07035 [Candidatus Dojkabacteria bacterium]|nr:hypothetical protein [Candidatus Dojkabacteria bacterium]